MLLLLARLAFADPAIVGAVHTSVHGGRELIVDADGQVIAADAAFDLLVARSNSVSHALTTEQVNAGIANYNADRTADAVVVSDTLVVDLDGRVRDGHAIPLHAQEVTRALGDDDMEATWRGIRRRDRAIWVPVIVVGAAGTGVGALGLIAGVGDFVFVDLWDGGGTGRSGTEFEIGAVAAAIGGAGLGTGIVGLKVAARKHDDPLYYYDESYLRERFGSLAESDPPRLQAHVVVGPGWLGVSGTF